MALDNLMMDDSELGPESIVKLEDLPDGSSVYQIAALGEEQIEEEPDFYENLAEVIPHSELNKIAGDLLEAIEQDKDSRSEWEQAYLKGMDYMGVKVEEFRDLPFARACSAFDTTFSTALVRFFSMSRDELFPPGGPVSFDIIGEPDDELYNKGDRIKDWMNYYLTDVDKNYYPDSYRLLLYLAIVGCAFRKVYQDPITKRPLARFINPQDFIVNNNCTSIQESDRLTHVLHLSRKEIELRRLAGYYRGDTPPSDDDGEDSENSATTQKVNNIEGVDTESYSKKSLFTYYECHADINLKDHEYFVKEDDEKSDIPLPYIVTICKETRKIERITRNWEEDDPEFKRIEYFTQYNYLPGLGIYGMGLWQLIGSNVIVLTSLQRQLVDAGTLKNFPGGLVAKGFRIEENDKGIGPGEFRQIETGGLPIKEVMMPMPYAEPSVVLKDLRNEIVQQTQALASISETQIAENNANAPVGTTLALLEVANKPQSSVFRSLHESLTRELGLLYRLFGKYFGDEPYPFRVKGKNLQIMREDFSPQFKLIPVSDPKLMTATQRILQNEALLRLASSAPQFFDMREIYRRVCEGLGINELDKVMPEPQETPSLDAVTENKNALEGKPLKAAPWQDHRAHNMTHMALQHLPDVQAHMREHEAMQYYLEMQQAMGIQMPPLEQLQDPEIQNAISLKAAEATQQILAQQQAQQPQPLDPNQVMMADIQQRHEETLAKERISERKAEVESFKVTLKAETEKEKMNIDREMAEQKNETDLAIAHMRERNAIHNKQGDNNA